MSWREKLELARQRRLTDVDVQMVFDCAAGAPETFIESVRSRAPFVSTGYLEFLRQTDGAQFDFFVLFGSGSSQFASLWDSNQIWNGLVNLSSGLVIGEDAAGAPFVLRDDGSIRVLSIDPPGETERMIARDMETLLNDVLMGSKYDSLFPFGPRSDDRWRAFLGRQGWI